MSEVDKTDNVVEFIPKRDWESQLSAVAREATTQAINLPKQPRVNRMEVVAAFHQSFELIGGVPRLAIWADQNPSDFFKLYARLLPSQSTKELGDSKEIVITHVLPRTKLD